MEIVSKSGMRVIERALYVLVDEEDDRNKVSKYFNYFLMLLIVLSVGEMALETDDTLYKPYKYYFLGFDFFTVMVFSLEYLARVVTAHISDKTYLIHHNRLKSIGRYVFSVAGLIDLFSILPFYLNFTNLDLRVIRALRLLRFFRVFKIARYNSSIDLVVDVFKEKKSDLGVTSGLIIIVMIISSFLMYYAEHDAQPDNFPNVISCLWWSVVTLTTIGYGDVYPITAIGKIIGGTMAFLGIGLVAMPTGIISAGFLEKINERAKEREAKKHHQTAIDNKEDIEKNKEEIRRLKEKLAELQGEKLPDRQDAGPGNTGTEVYPVKTDGEKHFCPYCGNRLE